MWSTQCNSLEWLDMGTTPSLLVRAPLFVVVLVYCPCPVFPPPVFPPIPPGGAASHQAPTCSVNSSSIGGDRVGKVGLQTPHKVHISFTSIGRTGGIISGYTLLTIYAYQCCNSAGSPDRASLSADMAIGYKRICFFSCQYRLYKTPSGS